MRPIPAFALALLCLTRPTIAGEATFSSDGKTLWASPFDEKSGNLLALRKGTAPIQLPLPKEIRDDGGTRAIESDGGALLIAGEHFLWSWEPGKPDGVSQKLAPLPDRLFPTGVHRMQEGALKGTAFLTGAYYFDTQHPKPADFDEFRTFFGLRPGAKAFGEVFVRRVDTMTAAPAFSRDCLVFGGNGDIWTGSLTDMGEDENVRPYTLNGYRCAPVAFWNTNFINAGSLNVHEVAIAGDFVWAGLRGRHMAALMKVPLMKYSERWENADLAGAWKIASKQLADAKVVDLPEDSDRVSGLCSWNGPHGEWKVACCTNLRTWWLWQNDSKSPTKLGDDPTR
ncbi:MAG: hypothetical protein QM755_14330 [Luteolibacter sp.]